MSALLQHAASVEKEFSLIDGILYNIIVFDKPDGNYLLKYKFGNHIQYDDSIIGGLIATINEFSKSSNPSNIKSIGLEQVKLLFVNKNEFIFAFVVDPDYPISQFESAVSTFIECFDDSYNIQDYGSGPDGVSIAFQMILILISEELKIEIELGDRIGIYPFKLQEVANKTANTVIGSDPEVKVYEIKDKTSTDDNDENFITKEDLEAETEIKSIRDALHHLLSRFVSTIADIKSITLIRTTPEGLMDKITKSNLSPEIEDKLFATILGMIDTVSLLLQMEDEDNRTIDLDGYWIYFHEVSLTSFIYVIVESKLSLDLIKPLVERVVININTLFPEDSL